MPDEGFEALKVELLRGGVAPVYVERTILELGEHYTDLRSDALAAGMSDEEAACNAWSMLGSEQSIAAAILGRPELLAWDRRWPRIAVCLRSAATLGALPGLPVVFCVDHRPDIARWGGAIGAAMLLVGSILAGLNWLIVLS
jgi:hypothetical protein